MKKLISVITTFMLLFSCFGLTSFAAPASVEPLTPATISDDYQKLYLDGNTYVRFNASKLNVEYFSSDIPVALSDSQSETIAEVILDTNENLTMILTNIHYKDGAVLSISFLREDYLDSYEKMTTGSEGTYIIDFEYPDGNTITVEKEALHGDKVTLTSEALEMCDYFPVVIQDENGSLMAYMGCLITTDNNYYYVDFTETQIESWYEFSPYDYSELPSYEISDAEIIANIEACMDTYYSEDLGFLLDDSLTNSVSTVFLILVFAIIPLAIFITFLILAIRSKSIYKKMFRITYILSATELVIFTVITMLIKFGK